MRGTGSPQTSARIDVKSSKKSCRAVSTGQAGNGVRAWPARVLTAQPDLRGARQQPAHPVVALHGAPQRPALRAAAGDLQVALAPVVVSDLVGIDRAGTRCRRPLSRSRPTRSPPSPVRASARDQVPPHSASTRSAARSPRTRAKIGIPDPDAVCARAAIGGSPAHSSPAPALAHNSSAPPCVRSRSTPAGVGSSTT